MPSPPTPTATPTLLPVPANLDCALDTNNTAWLPPEILAWGHTLYWVDAAGPRHAWCSIRPGQSRPAAGTVVLVERDVNLNSLEARLLAWCAPAGGTACLASGTPARLAPFNNRPPYDHSDIRWHPSQHTLTNRTFEVSSWFGSPSRFRFAQGSGAACIVAPPVTTVTPTEHGAGQGCNPICAHLFSLS